MDVSLSSPLLRIPPSLSLSRTPFPPNSHTRRSFSLLPNPKLSATFPRKPLIWRQNQFFTVAAQNQEQSDYEDFVLEEVPHLTNFLPDLPSFLWRSCGLTWFSYISHQSYPNPLHRSQAYAVVKDTFVSHEDVVAQKVYFTSEEVRACVVTCGGLCPGINTVVREIVCGLSYMYGVDDILGIEGGYRGFYSKNTKKLTPKVVNDIHKRGGTFLQTSRGGHDTNKIVDNIQDRGINQVYIIGGDGTQKGAAAIYKVANYVNIISVSTGCFVSSYFSKTLLYFLHHLVKEVEKRGIQVAVAGIPKTIDNDIAVIDKSFGFDTAVEEAQRAINAAHVEVESVENGIGIVKLMGRYSGFIAMYATLASRDVDCCLIPESPFYLEGKGGLFEFIDQRLKENGHMVIVLAEGAGQDYVAQSMQAVNEKDASGNKLLLDSGLWLNQKIKDHFSDVRKTAVNMKYIDPTYMIRAIPSNASDNIYCTLLAHSAVHGAMAGYTGFTVGPVNSRHAYIPISVSASICLVLRLSLDIRESNVKRHVLQRVTQTTNTVKLTDRMWARLLASTNQPTFLQNNETMLGRVDGDSMDVSNKMMINSS
ncbi:hypothetical protein RJ639_033122 [Escallonia herrerae]|uniref:Phosphofructokinase domain-containing protein n=1 Tax=Escallonia herrerae TaxID=1293975 RepID=A0AA89BDZ2_9ASTE|nr:hypothetical protein RJ639_033122 [Escallonia herrerae]